MGLLEEMQEEQAAMQRRHKAYMARMAAGRQSVQDAELERCQCEEEENERREAHGAYMNAMFRHIGDQLAGRPVRWRRNPSPP